jgi:DNA-nicking Smr family endonuclease
MKDSDNDLDLFRESVGSVRRLKSDRVRSRPPAPRAIPAQRQLDEGQVMKDLASAPIDFSAVETGEEITYLRPGLQKRVLSRLRRGHWRVQDHIDLHQMNLEAAGRSIRAFLEHADREACPASRSSTARGCAPARPDRRSSD